MNKGTVENKDSFLGMIADKLNRPRITDPVARPVWKNSPQWEVLRDANQEELVEVLKKQCLAIHTQLVETSVSDLKETIRQELMNLNASSLVTWKDERFFEYGLSEFFTKECPEQDIDSFTWDPTLSREENVKMTEKADVGITFSDITLAESGTVVLFSGSGKGRSVSLLPTNYIALIPKSSLVPRMTQAASFIHHEIERGNDVASCVNFISGPSNSADIELNLVVGVHGPVRATYIIIDDK
ncbi:lactate utilization protein C [Thalassobacillus sp. C254]|uniref:LutC/YkgG family protein n=1 Tax=Thalassobacillus sp. C254 TaxID=1225341 RepID=UPI0006D0A5BB|nr:lactate utilization protein C [Thalassobacillus sp. C254]